MTIHAIAQKFSIERLLRTCANDVQCLSTMGFILLSFYFHSTFNLRIQLKTSTLNFFKLHSFLPPTFYCVPSSRHQLEATFSREMSLPFPLHFTSHQQQQTDQYRNLLQCALLFAAVPDWRHGELTDAIQRRHSFTMAAQQSETLTRSPSVFKKSMVLNPVSSIYATLKSFNFCSRPHC